MKNIDSSEFNSVIKDKVMIQFSATWCWPCKALTKTLEEHEDELKISSFKVDIDACPDIASEYKIKSVPTIILFNAGKEIKRIIGSKSIDQLKEFIS